MRRQWMQQRLSQQSTQIPDDIARLAHEQQLGTPQAGYMVIKLRRHWRWFQYLFPLIFLLFLAMLIGLLFPLISLYPFPIPIIILMTFYLFFITWLLVIIIMQRIYFIYICSEGIILKQSMTKLRSIRWNEIETITYDSARIRTSLFFRRRLYAIRSHDGSTLTLSGQRPVLARLDQAFEREFTRRRLPFLLADLRAGQRLNFGPLSIDVQGVYATDRLLPWEQVADMTLENDRRLVISQLADPPRRWQSFPIQKIPNPGILLALFQRMRSGQSEQEAGMQTLAAYSAPTVIVQSRRRVDPLPEELFALAGEHQLGERRLDQKLGRRRFASWAAIIACAIFGAICLIFSVIWIKIISLPSAEFDTFSFLSSILFYCIPLTAISTLNLIFQLRYINTHTYTFEHGLIFQRGRNAPVVFRWEDVETVWRKPMFSTGRNRSASYYQNAYAYTLQLRDGSRHTFTRLNIDQQALSKIVREQIVPLQLPGAIAAYQGGQTISFGPAQIDRRGITLDARSLPWSQVRSVTLQGNRLVVFEIARRKPWGKADARRVPNLFLLFALADYARTGSLAGSEV